MLSSTNSFQFFRLCIGAGMRPPRATNSRAEKGCTGWTGAEPSSPPNSTVSPTVQPGAGMMRTAVVLEDRKSVV